MRCKTHWNENREKSSWSEMLCYWTSLQLEYTFISAVSQDIDGQYLTNIITSRNLQFLQLPNWHIYNNKVHGLPTMKIDTSKIITKYVYIHSASTLRQSLKPDENLEVMYTALECSPTSRDCTLLQSTGYSMLHNNFTVKSLKTVY